jgi:hypothetical protein
MIYKLNMMLAPALAGAISLVVAACVQSPPPAQYPVVFGNSGPGSLYSPTSYTPPARPQAGTWYSSPDPGRASPELQQRYLAPSPVVTRGPEPGVPQVVTYPAALPMPAPNAPDEVPIDPSCGWWRLCNLWSGS